MKKRKIGLLDKHKDNPPVKAVPVTVSAAPNITITPLPIRFGLDLEAIEARVAANLTNDMHDAMLYGRPPDLFNRLPRVVEHCVFYGSNDIPDAELEQRERAAGRITDVHDTIGAFTSPISEESESALQTGYVAINIGVNDVPDIPNMTAIVSGLHPDHPSVNVIPGIGYRHFPQASEPLLMLHDTILHICQQPADIRLGMLLWIRATTNSQLPSGSYTLPGNVYEKRTKISADDIIFMLGNGGTIQSVLFI